MVETTVVLPVVSKEWEFAKIGEDTVTGVGRERLEKERGEKEGEREYPFSLSSSDGSSRRCI